MTTTIDWPTGSSDHAASNVKIATIIQFVPRPNPKREEQSQYQSLDLAMHSAAQNGDWATALALQTAKAEVATGHPWSGEDKA